MDAETFQTFLQETQGYLPSMRQGIMSYEHDAACLAELQNSRRLAHTIKGAAAILNLREIGEIAKELESDLKKVLQTKSHLTEAHANKLLSKILVLESFLNNLQTEVSSNLEKVTNAPQESAKNLQDTKPEEDYLAESDSKEFEVDAEMLEVFAEEAEDLLRNITANLGILEKAPNNREALLEIRRSSHTLKGSAGIIGLKKLSALAHRVEDLLDYLADNNIESNSQIFELLLASADCFAALAGGENSKELNEKIRRIYQTYDKVLTALKTPTAASANSGTTETNENSAETDEISTISLELEIPETSENQSNETANQNRAVARVSIERLNDLFNLVGEMVISRSVFQQRLSELQQQIEELHHTNRRLRLSTGKLETNFEVNTFGQVKLPAYNFTPGTPANPLSDLELEEFDALEFDHYTEFHQTTRELVETASDTAAINADLDNLLDNLNLLFDNQRRLIEEMRGNLLRLRMVSLNTLTPRLQRTVRVTAQEEAKLADLVVENENIEIDTEILDSFVEPLIHLLRNAVAHGIEPAETRRLLGKPERGKITLRAYSEGTHIVFVVSDDGRGISVAGLKEKAFQAGFVSKKELAAMSDDDAYSLVFLPGLSTAAEINQVSGRGVGMNVVSSSILRRQGTISIKSEPQKGSTFTIRLPMSMAVTRALLVKAGTQTFAFPLKLVKQVAEISKEEFQKAQVKKILPLDGISYSFFNFNELLNLPINSAAEHTKTPLILMENLETPSILAVDQILKTEEIVIKPLGSVLQNIPEIIGATVLGDGRIVPVLDLVYLLKKKEEKEKGRKVERENNNLAQVESASAQPLVAAPPPRLLSVMVVDDSPSVRQVNSALIKNTGWNVSVAKDGLEALEILQTSRRLPDVILTDVEMPRMDGYELLASLKRHQVWREIPVVMITSRTGDKHRRKAFDLGVDEYLTKPYEESFLLDKIKVLAK
jgi:chemosensory pili system protein ChpA (sensor histidine kinase/response regulator)